MAGVAGDEDLICLLVRRPNKDPKMDVLARKACKLMLGPIEGVQQVSTLRLVDCPRLLSAGPDCCCRLLLGLSGVGWSQSPSSHPFPFRR